VQVSLIFAIIVSFMLFIVLLSLRPMLAASQNFFSLFSFFFVSSYVGYVPESDDLGIFRFVWRC